MGGRLVVGAIVTLHIMLIYAMFTPHLTSSFHHHRQNHAATSPRQLPPVAATWPTANAPNSSNTIGDARTRRQLLRSAPRIIHVGGVTDQPLR